MKLSLSGLRLDNIKMHLQQVFQRFPVLCLYIGIAVIGFLVLIHLNPANDTEEFISRGIMSLIITFFLGLGAYISSESYGVSNTKKQLFQILPFVYGCLFYLGFDPSVYESESITFFIVTLFGIMSFIFFAPYIKKLISGKGKQSEYYSYFYRISTVFLLAFIFGGVLFTLGSIAIATITTLFDIAWRYSDKLYGDWATFALVCFTPLFALSQLPNANSYSKNTFQENTFFSFLIKFAATPAIFIYFLILYSYSIKVLLNFSDWPKGEVSWMVIGFSVFGYAVYMFSYVFEEKNTLIAKLRKYFPYVVLPQVLMLFYAIYLRIAQYDITMNRYFVVVFGIWLTCISLYYIFSKQKYLAIIPFLLTIFTIIISIGPWSVYQFPESRQLARLQANLIAAKILVNGSVTPLTNYEDISEELSSEIYSGIDYLCEFNDCKTIKELFPEQYQSALETYISEQGDNIFWGDEKPKPTKWEIVKFITEQLKIRQFTTTWGRNNYISLYLDSNNNFFPLNLGNYETLIQVDAYDSFAQLQGFIDIQKELLYIKESNNTLEEVSLSHIFSQLQEKYPHATSKVVDPADVTYDLTGKIYDMRILFESINIRQTRNNSEPKHRYHGNVNGYILLKQK